MASQHIPTCTRYHRPRSTLAGFGLLLGDIVVLLACYLVPLFALVKFVKFAWGA